MNVMELIKLKGLEMQLHCNDIAYDVKCFKRSIINYMNNFLLIIFADDSETEDSTEQLLRSQSMFNTILHVTEHNTIYGMICDLADYTSLYNRCRFHCIHERKGTVMGRID